MWRVEIAESARRELRALDKSSQKHILQYLKTRVATAPDPRAFGKPLRSRLAGLWRYRVRDYRIICRIEDNVLCVLVVRIGHRKDVYDE